MSEAEQKLLWWDPTMKDTFYANTFDALPDVGVHEKMAKHMKVRVVLAIQSRSIHDTRSVFTGTARGRWVCIEAEGVSIEQLLE